MPSPAIRADRPLAGIAMRLASVVLLAAMFAASKVAGERGVHLAEIVFWRQALALPVVLAVVAASGGLATLATARPLAHVRRMAVGLSGMVCNFGAVALLPLAEATTFGFTVPIFATVLSALALREATGRFRWAAVAVGFAGVLIVLQPGGGHVSAAGAAVALAGAVLTAVVTVLIRDLGRTERPTTIVFWFTLTSLVPTGIALPFFATPHDLATWAIVGVMGLSGGLAQLALTASLRLAPVATVMPMDYTSLLWATALGWWLFGTLPAPLTWLGAPIIVGSGLVIVWREHRLRRDKAAVAVVD